MCCNLDLINQVVSDCLLGTIYLQEYFHRPLKYWLHITNHAGPSVCAAILGAPLQDFVKNKQFSLVDTQLKQY